MKYFKQRAFSGKSFFKAFAILAHLISPLFAQGLQAQTDGSVSFRVETIAKSSSQYSPKHVLAIWVEDENGNHVKNLELSADKRKQYLYTWNKKSGGISSDISSGATLSNHTTHQKTWDCRNKSGALVADGSYKIITEFTSEHAQGPISTVAFTKASGSITLNPAQTSNFTNISLIYTPETPNGIGALVANNFSLDIYPNPVKEAMNIVYTLEAPTNVNLSIYNMNMQLITVIDNKVSVSGKNEFLWNPSPDLTKGSYILVFQSERIIAGRKFILTE